MTLLLVRYHYAEVFFSAYHAVVLFRLRQTLIVLSDAPHDGCAGESRAFIPEVQQPRLLMLDVQTAPLLRFRNRRSGAVWTSSIRRRGCCTSGIKALLSPAHPSCGASLSTMSVWRRRNSTTAW